ncbi:VOC family protein [Sneathiella marina]|uniref:VOC family protein n=1 Tax=Sneathiella marina TaxID=2950108 RepID=A0ABY4W6W8_9PROT|nr:VOC family protein [Sneathiella marina]USG62930.1 VOC family protein [Sneathiella marina]
MHFTQFYPVIQTLNVSETTDFFRDNFDFQVIFEADWYVHLQSAENESVNIAILNGTHETIPMEGRGISSGVIINFEVADVDKVYSRAKKSGLPIILDLKDEDFGQRHFITRDPNGLLIDVITPIDPKGEYVDQFVN